MVIDFLKVAKSLGRIFFKLLLIAFDLQRLSMKKASTFSVKVLLSSKNSTNAFVPPASAVCLLSDSLLTWKNVWEWVETVLALPANESLPFLASLMTTAILKIR